MHATTSKLGSPGMRLLPANNSPSNKLHEVVIEGNTSSSIKDAGVSVPNEVTGHNLKERREYIALYILSLYGLYDSHT